MTGGALWPPRRRTAAAQGEEAEELRAAKGQSAGHSTSSVLQNSRARKHRARVVLRTGLVPLSHSQNRVGRVSQFQRNWRRKVVACAGLPAGHRLLPRRWRARSPARAFSRIHPTNKHHLPAKCVARAPNLWRRLCYLAHLRHFLLSRSVAGCSTFRVSWSQQSVTWPRPNSSRQEMCVYCFDTLVSHYTRQPVPPPQFADATWCVTWAVPTSARGLARAAAWVGPHASTRHE